MSRKKEIAELLKIYEEIHKDDDVLPNKATEPKRDFSYEQRVINNLPTTAAKRTDNTSGYTGISFAKNRWKAKICYNKIRYTLGRFETLEEAIEERSKAEKLLKQNPDVFVEEYSKKCRQYAI